MESKHIRFPWGFSYFLLHLIHITTEQTPNLKQYWFKAKRYGWGWTPATWQGWLIIFLYIALILILVSTKEDVILGNPSSGSNFLTFALPIIALTTLLIFICYKKGEKPGWHWGKSSEK